MTVKVTTADPGIRSTFFGSGDAPVRAASSSASVTPMKMRKALTPITSLISLTFSSFSLCLSDGGGTSLHALWDDARPVFDGQQVNHFLLFCPRHLPGHLLVAAHHLRVPPLASMHRPADASPQIHASVLQSNNVKQHLCVSCYHDDRSLVTKDG